MPISSARLPLHPHPGTPRSPLSAIEAACGFDADGALDLRFELRGELAGLRLPAPAAPRSADGLWRHSCCEAFLAAAGEAAYREFNFSPSGCWATYAFDDYRQPAAAGFHAGDPRIALERGVARLALVARLAPGWLPPGERLQLGLSVVCEAADGSLSYWALAHPVERPDFHHRAGFVLELARP